MKKPPSLLTVLSRNLELLMVKRGWTSPTVASKLGVNPDSINRIRAGRSKYLDPEMLENILNLFEVTPDTLLLPQDGVIYDFGD